MRSFMPAMCKAVRNDVAARPSLAACGMAFCMCVVSAVANGDAAAQTYPTRSVRFTVPYPAGGPADILARVIGQKLTAKWGQQVIIDNRGGANTIIGMELVARSAPDGHTL